MLRALWVPAGSASSLPAHLPRGGRDPPAAQPGTNGFALLRGQCRAWALHSVSQGKPQGRPCFKVTLPQFPQLCFPTGCHLMMLDFSVSRKGKTFLTQQCFLGKMYQDSSFTAESVCAKWTIILPILWSIIPYSRRTILSK